MLSQPRGKHAPTQCLERLALGLHRYAFKERLVFGVVYCCSPIPAVANLCLYIHVIFRILHGFEVLARLK